MKTTEMSTHEPDIVPVVMVIEDDAAVGDVIAAVLEDEAFEVVLARTALAADEVCRSRADLLVLDLVLHGAETGWEFVRALASATGTPCIPVIVCTARKTLAQREEILLGTLAVAIVHKPFDINELSGAIAAALATSSP
jgi:DNA-binding response OmpR family regulator